MQKATFLSEALASRLKVTESSVVQFCQRWQVQELALFGSVIRDDFSADSDVDVLVVFEPERRCDAFARVDIQNELAQLFGRDVDLTEKRLIKNPVSRAEIGRSHRIIYPPELANFIGIEKANREMIAHARNRAALLDMVGAMRAIGEFVQDRTYESYQTDLFFRSAVERQLEILGEAANRLPEFQAAHLEIDGSNVVGLRNVIIHQYDEIDYEEIWAIATERVPLLFAQIQPLMSKLTEEEDAWPVLTDLFEMTKIISLLC